MSVQNGVDQQEVQSALNAVSRLCCQELELLLRQYFCDVEDLLLAEGRAIDNNHEQNLIFSDACTLRMESRAIIQGMLAFLDKEIIFLSDHHRHEESLKEKIFSTVNVLTPDQRRRQIQVFQLSALIEQLEAKLATQLSVVLGHINQQISRTIKNNKDFPLSAQPLMLLLLEYLSAVELMPSTRQQMLELYAEEVSEFLPELFKKTARLLNRGGTLDTQTMEAITVNTGVYKAIEEDVPESLLQALDKLQKVDSDKFSLLRLKHEYLTELPMLRDEEAIQDATDKVLPWSDENSACVLKVVRLLDLMYQDNTLPLSLRCQLGFLQIPLIKAALLDKRGFADAQHSIRQLLRELTALGSTWIPKGDAKNDEVYRKVSDVVNGVLKEYQRDPIALQDSLIELTNWQELSQRNERVLYNRAEKVQAIKEMSETYRQHVEMLIKEKTYGITLTKNIAELIKQHWSNVLFLKASEHGLESESFSKAVLVLDDLLWTLNPDDKLGSRQRFLRIVPNVLKQLRKELLKIQLSAEKISECFSELEKAHLITLRQTNSQNDSDTNAADKATLLRQKGEALLNTINIGQWVDMHSSPDIVHRCKLAAVIKERQHFIFTDYRGKKVAELLKQDFLNQLITGDIQVLEGGNAFDKVLESMIAQRKSDN